MKFFDRKMNIVICFGKKKAKVKLLAITPYAKVRIIRNFNEIIKKYKIQYDHLVSEDFKPPEYALTTKFIESEMLDRNLEICIYSVNRTGKISVFETIKNFIVAFLIVSMITIFLFGLTTLFNQYF